MAFIEIRTNIDCKSNSHNYRHYQKTDPMKKPAAELGLRKTQTMLSDVPVFGARGRAVGDVPVGPAELDGLDLVEEVSVEKGPQVRPGLDGVPHGVGEEGLFPPGLGPLGGDSMDFF